MRNLFCCSLVACLCCIYLPAGAQKKSDKPVNKWIKENGKKLHLSDADFSEMKITASHTTTNKLTFTYVQQYYKKLKVYNAVYSICFDSVGNLVSNNSSFVNSIETKATSSAPLVAASDAVAFAAKYLKLNNPVDLKIVPHIDNTNQYIVFSSAGIAKKNIIAELMWVTADEGRTVQLAWNITIDVLKSADCMNVRVDAITGKIINADNLTVYEKMPAKNNAVAKYNDQYQTIQTTLSTDKINQPSAITNAAYNVLPLPLEAPSFGALSTINNPWLNAGVGNPVAVFGWHSDGTTEYNYTRGNNVMAYDDRAGTNAPGNYDISSTSLSNLTFSKVPNFVTAPTVTNNMRAATTNLFYMNNMMHDISYQYGFDEASGNFQVNNNGRGGTGSDPVRAEAQDGGGNNNANMSTPVDGLSPTMQMYLWSGPSTLTVNTPPSIAGNYFAIEGAVSTNNIMSVALTGTAIYYNDDAGGTTHLGCGAAANTISGKIALISRGSCNFTVKIKNAQNAGAIAVVIIDNVVESPFSMSGPDNTITIPAVMISQADGATLLSQIGSGESITLNPSIKLDGDYDNGIIAHEYTHGISTRLTGGPANSSCLNNAEEGGEGWSDYLALMVTQNWATTTLADSLMKRSMGTYVFSEPTTGDGLRTYPYSLNKTINPHSYADLNATALGSEVHYIGEVWTTTLWDMTWRIIQQVGAIEPDIYNAAGTGGNVIALNDVMMGMKLQVCSPGFIDARNAILKADTLLYAGQHVCAIWSAFARRGMGVSASQGSSNSTSDQVVAYDIPTSINIQQISSVDSTTAGNTITYTINASCGCNMLSNLSVVDSLPVGMNYSNSSAGTVNGNVVTIPLNFTQAPQTLSFTIDAQPLISGCTITYPVNDNRNGSTVGGFTTAGGWSVSSVKSSSPSSSWFASEPTTATNKTLTSSSIALSNTAELSFMHYFNTENMYDGGVIEISTNAGSTWQDLGTKIIKNGYTATMDASTTLAGKPAFTGLSGTSFQQTLVDLSAYTGQTVLIRFRSTSDVGNSSTVEGWFVDDIKMIQGCGLKNAAYIFNNTPAIVSTAKTITFIKPVAVLPITIKDFIAGKIGEQQKVKITWSVENENSISTYIIEHSAGSNVWDNIGNPYQAGSGTYILFDNAPATGMNYYRLKIYYKDGSINYSAIKKVEFNNAPNNSFVLSPNPAGNYVDIAFNSDAQFTLLNIFDAMGKLVITQKTNGNTRINTTKLLPGLYYIKSITAKGYSATKKLIIAK